MGGYSTWPIRDIIFIGLLIFNAGGILYVGLNHIKHLNRKMEQVLQRLGTVEQRISRVEGRLLDIGRDRPMPG